MAYELIETVTLTADAASIEFTSIPQDGVDLLLVLSARTARAADIQDGLFVNPNGATTNKNQVRLLGNGSSVGSATRPDILTNANSNNATADTYSNSSVYISNYTSGSAKSFSLESLIENNATLGYQYLIAGLWNDTSAITSIELTSETLNNLVAGSTASLYKIS